MAKRKKSSSKKKAVSTSRSKSVAKSKKSAGLPTNWRDQIKEDIEEESERVPSGAGNTIKQTGKGTFTYQGADVGEELEVVIIDHAIVKKWFETDYDEDNPSPPSCFAVKLSQTNIAPHETSPAPQADICDDCEMNEWGSGRKRGKACSDKHRLAVVPLDVLLTSPDLAMIEVPVTSGALFRKHVKSVNKAVDLPCYGVVTTLSVDEHIDHQNIVFSMERELKESELAAAFGLRKEARAMVLEAYDVSGYQKPKGSKSSSKKKKATKKKRRSRVS